MKWIECTLEAHAAPILAIFNEAIQNSTALYDHAPRTMDSMRTWFATKSAGNFPIIGVATDDGELMGFASYGTFRAWDGYLRTVEHSVYVQRDHRQRGLGEQLMRELIERARSQHHHVMVGVIDADNHASVDLHLRLGFTHAGTLRQTGFKFGRWLDVAFYQLILNDDAAPEGSLRHVSATASG